MLSLASGRVSAEREDGIAQQVEARIGESIAIGELAAGETWNAKIAFGNLAEGDVDAFRLYFKASAWNAKAAGISVLTRTTGADESEVPEALATGNDGFVSATAIDGEEGSVGLDLIRAQTEPGEPVFTPRFGRPAGSAWYEWTAPSDDMVNFGVTHDVNPGSADTVRVDVFRGDGIAALEPIASADWGVQFFAESGQVYRIRLSHAARSVPLVLNWSMGPRPLNDDFAAAVVIEDATGDVDGTNAGATLEPGEFFGDLAGTVWYRWTAPSDGAWEFETNTSDLRVLAFVGERLSDLRLVSGFADDRAVFPAQGGDVYRIAVASRDAEASGKTFELTWGAVDDRVPGNDDFAGAEEIPGEASSSHGVGIDREATVEPGEPVESGIRTKWWTWTAPSDGTFTWRIEELTRPTSGAGNRLMVSVFAGDDLNDLQLVATNGVAMAIEFAFKATGGQRYWISVGLPAEDQWAFTSFWYGRADMTLVWGPTPDNDEAAGAAVIDGVSGSVSGTNAFATGTRGERSDILGRSTLWWTYEAPASGWVRFAVEEGGSWALTVHRDSTDSLGLDVVGTSRWQRSEGEVLFEAREGVRYMIALGVSGGVSGGEFTLRWEEADDPNWLRYAGRLMDGDRDSHGNPVEIRNPGALAVHASGTALYLASGIGLQVFEPDSVTGQLDAIQLIETDFDLTGASLIWDRNGNRLVANTPADCSAWRSFSPLGDGPQLADGGELVVDDDPWNCGRSGLLIDPGGSHLYRYGNWGLDVYELEASGLGYLQSERLGHVMGAALSSDGEHLYALTSSELRVFERAADSGMLASTDFAATIHTNYSFSYYRDQRVPLAISDDGGHLVVADNVDPETVFFSLEDPLRPEQVAALPMFWDQPNSYGRVSCGFADIRAGSVAVDVLCGGLALAARWDPSTLQATGTDAVASRQGDRFNGVPPDFAAPLGFAASPDDSYLYLSTPSHGIVIFGRGAPPADGGGPDLVVGSLSVDDAEPAPGAAFRLSVAVRNEGDGDSANTTLRFYRSADASITPADTSVGSDAVPGIAASGTSQHSINLTAPNDPGTYHYGACVDEVADEADVENNCSTAIAVTVAGNGYTGEPDLVVESPSVDDNSPAPSGAFTLSVVVRNQGDGASAGTTLRYYRSTNTTISTRDTEVGTDAVSGITAGESSTQSIDLTAPTATGTYHYGACVDDVASESEVENNCSTAVTITVAEDDGAPDLVVRSPAVDEASLAPGGAFAFSATVANDGVASAASTTLRYYRSTNAMISRGDTEIGTDAVPALAASETVDESIELTAPATPGTYYYGACVDSVDDESDTENNCSDSVAVTVSGDDGAPDLIVESPSVSESEVSPGGSFTLSATVRNQGEGRSVATTLRYYRSTNTLITSRDTEVGTDAVEAIVAAGSSTQSIDLTAPDDAGTYYYGACVDDVADESTSRNNCSSSVAITVAGGGDAGAPDLIVESPSVSESEVSPGGTFTLGATVRNRGDGAAAATTLRYYRSDDASISSGDTEVGTDAVAGLAAGANGAESISLTAPSDAGTYYYGACVDSVSGESDTANNCSDGEEVEVTSISETQAPDLVVESPSVSESDVGPGASFTLSATVRNAGDGDAAATTLRYYRSSDESVSMADTEVGTEAIIALPVSATAHGSITVEAPMAAGTYHYGACVDGVPGESDSRNNCSGAVQLSVGVDGPTEGEDFDLDPDNTWPLGIAYANGRFHVVDQSDGKVYAYTVNGDRDASFDFDLASGNDRPSRIVHADDNFFVAESSEGKLYAYEPDGRRDEDADLDLDGDNSLVAGIAFGNDRIYVADYWDAKLYVYGSDGARDTAAEFDLHRDNQNAAGLAYVDGRIYVVDSRDDKLFVYGTDGERDTAREFNLNSENRDPGGVVQVNGRFYVLDRTDDKVYAYNPEAADLVAESPSASDEMPELEASFTFNVTVANRGRSRSAATTVRYYRSDDDAISATDSEVGSDAVAALDADGTSDFSTELTAPASSGVHYYGACVDAVPDEFDDGNNCSSAVRVSVPGPDLVVESPAASDYTPDAGSSFTLSVIVRNAGERAAPASTLRYYRSTNLFISDEDVEVGTQSVEALSAAAQREQTIALTAPSTTGTHYYGACVDAVAGEPDGTGNCTRGVLLNVGDDGVEAFDLVGENGLPKGIVHASGRFYVVDRGDKKVYAYGSDGQHQSASDFDLDTDNLDPSDLAYANNRFHIVDIVDDKVYAYHSNGQRDTSADFDFEPLNGNAVGIVRDGERFFVLDWRDGKIYAYQGAGQREPAADFALDADNRSADGLAYVDDRFYVGDFVDDKVYAYWSNGQRDEASDVDLHADNGLVRGIAHANGMLYVLDETDEEVYAYPLPEQTDEPDLVVDSAASTDGAPAAGASFDFSVTVRNRGSRPSTATTLRYYRSPDATISSDDTELHSESLDSLMTSASAARTTSLTAPEEDGCYFCGACVDDVEGEGPTANNCSRPVEILVGERPDLDVTSARLHYPFVGRFGEPIRMTVEVTNVGDGDASPAKLRFSNGTEVEIPALAPDETTTVERHRVGSVSLGRLTFSACVLDAPCERETANNCVSRSVTYR